ncbi:DUF4350 domain-containing protein [Amycolatopsis acidiphila]|uniref:DUF4350 domain-containing protein n=1 Tax=Amycolatopsis acidiphila TaxID=715473 RepID=A0A557ZTC0_9PSEU|nr:DUF4350 domain-containing protein [Amycolatopsis acidiphila]TVT15274.1 DUF4350 domain-containing protein [Amycolatopsis acidiphila]UIJ61015.1 DUF4350 domain-containing protein [Amycolatopsis acidiphila]GHG88859.1 hypothetical protein GCM10017788_63390 [Amycolatopsis acidiphila]
MTTVSPDARRIWRAARAPVFIAVVLVLGAVLLVLARDNGNHGTLDPDSTDPGGSHALATLLAQQGVHIVPAHTLADAESALGTEANATLLVTAPSLVEPAHLAQLRGRAADAVFVGPGQDVLDLLLPGVVVRGQNDASTRSPDCTVAAAVAAGDAVLGGLEYEGHQRGRPCYGGSLLQITGSTTLLGDGTPLTNDRLDDEGDAALALRLLGRQATLVWYVPSPGDPAAAVTQQSLTELLPRGWLFGAIQVAVAAVLFALWRARRLGPVVAEPLPVVVRSAETTEGRARLYRRSGSAAHAAGLLRHAAVERLLPVLGLGAGAEPAAVLGAVAARTGRDAGPLLYGPAPEDDASLVRLADELDRLEREVRGS